MRKLRVQPQARVDLLEIWHFIAKDNIDQANQVGEELEQGIRDLVQMPGKGHTRADVKNPLYRFWRIRSYVIAYRFDNETLTIMRVVHGARDFRKLFK